MFDLLDPLWIGHTVDSLASRSPSQHDLHFFDTAVLLTRHDRVLNLISIITTMVASACKVECRTYTNISKAESRLLTRV